MIICCFLKYFHCLLGLEKVYNLHGMSEIGRVFTSDSFGYLGHPVKGIKTKIVSLENDEGGEDNDTNEGELLIYCESMSSTPYLKMTDKQNTDAFYRGSRYFRSGDFVCIDEDGRYKYIDRLKTLIALPPYGNKIALIPLEEKLERFEEVNEAGISDLSVTLNGVEEVKLIALVVLKSNLKQNTYLTMELIKEQFNSYANVETPYFLYKMVALETLPRNSRGKLDRQKLKQIVQTINLLT